MQGSGVSRRFIVNEACVRWHQADTAGQLRQVGLREPIGRSNGGSSSFSYAAFDSPDGKF